MGGIVSMLVAVEKSSRRRVGLVATVGAVVVTVVVVSCVRERRLLKRRSATRITASTKLFAHLNHVVL